MTVVHTVLLKFKDNVEAHTIDRFFSELYTLGDDTPGLLRFQCGSYKSTEGLNQGFTHAFMMEFDTEKNRDHYLNHPKHKSLAGAIIDTLEGSIEHGAIAFDFVAEEHPLTPRSTVDFTRTLLDDSEGANPEELQRCQHALHVLQKNIKNNPDHGIRFFGNNRSLPLPFNNADIESLLTAVSHKLEEIKPRMLSR